MDANSFYGAPAGWYPDPIGLPQLRWWDSTAWTHQTTGARAPMVMQETTYAWPEDEVDDDSTDLLQSEEDLPTRRERRHRERLDVDDGAVPTALTLLQLEPPSKSDVQRDVPDPTPFEQFTNSAPQAEKTTPDPIAAAKAASRQNSQEKQTFNWALPVDSRNEPQGQTDLKGQSAQRSKSSNNTAVWMIALIPLLQLVLSLLVLTAFGTADASETMVAIWIAPYPITIGLAVLDRHNLKKIGHKETAHWLWALLSAPIYLIARAIAAIRESGGGFGPILVWFALTLLQIIAIGAVPGLLISTIPSVFSTLAEQSIVSDAAVTGATLDVTCPTSPPVMIGQTFDCSGTHDGVGDPYDIVVSLQHLNGWIDWRVDDWGIYTIG